MIIAEEIIRIEEEFVSYFADSDINLDLHAQQDGSIIEAKYDKMPIP